MPISVVEAQNYEESGYGANEGPSSGGAIGPWQFLPSTYTGLGFSAGTEWQWPESTQAYIKYMNQLLSQEGGSVFKALEAYNAGPGNLGAGAGYASTILANANAPAGTTAPGKPTGAQAASFPIPGIPGIPGMSIPGFGGSDIFSGIAGDLINPILQQLGVSSLKDLFQRLGLILLGSVLLIVGLTMIGRDVGSMASMPQPSSGSGEGDDSTEILSDDESETTPRRAKAAPKATPASRSPAKAVAKGGTTSGLVSKSAEAAVMA
jgi:hypothetical protein